MPVVAIKLNDYSVLWNKRINAEFFTDDMLWNVLNANFLEKFVAQLLEAVRANILLLCNHSHNLFGEFLAFVSALVGTVFIFSALEKRWRSGKFFSAHFACAMNPVSPLPFVSVFHTTEVVFRLIKSALGDVNQCAAKLARHILSAFRIRWWHVLKIALVATIPDFLVDPAGHSIATTCAGKGSFLSHWAGVEVTNPAICTAKSVSTTLWLKRTAAHSAINHKKKPPVACRLTLAKDVSGQQKTHTTISVRASFGNSYTSLARMIIPHFTDIYKSLMVAAIKHGRKFIGCDLSERWVKRTEQRILTEAQTVQPSLLEVA